MTSQSRDQGGGGGVMMGVARMVVTEVGLGS